MAVITVHLAYDATGAVDPTEPMLIIGPDGSPAMGQLLPGELELFGGQAVADFEAELSDGTWRLIRRVGAN
jgi:hypothetical protein